MKRSDRLTKFSGENQKECQEDQGLIKEFPFCLRNRGHQEWKQEGSKVYFLDTGVFPNVVCGCPLVSDGPMVRDLG